MYRFVPIPAKTDILLTLSLVEQGGEPAKTDILLTLSLVEQGGEI